MPGFDEVELDTVPLAEQADESAEKPESSNASAPLSRRLFALITDLSLFAALSLALAPLLPASRDLPATVALAGFIVIVSYHYFVGTWMLWGKTVGGAIFDVRVVSVDSPGMALQQASWRWGGTLLSLLTAGIGFVLAASPSRLSLADRVSDTRCVAGR